MICSISSGQGQRQTVELLTVSECVALDVRLLPEEQLTFVRCDVKAKSITFIGTSSKWQRERRGRSECQKPGYDGHTGEQGIP